MIVEGSGFRKVRAVPSRAKKISKVRPHKICWEQGRQAQAFYLSPCDYYISQVKRCIVPENLKDQGLLPYQKHLAEHLSNYLALKEEFGKEAWQVQGKRLGRKIICFDLDETLVRAGSREPEAEILELAQGTLRVEVRPFATQTLKRLSKNFTIVLYTAGIEEYAQKVRDLLDVDNSFIEQVYHRSHCVKVSDKYIKDLGQVSSELSQVLLVDNSLSSFIRHPFNGVPILPYYGGLADSQLLRLQSFLMGFTQVADVRQLVRKHFCPDWLYKGGWVRELHARRAQSSLC